jgi:GTP-binding protein YchF
MQIGIIGLPQAGKTTVFNALTGRDQPTVRGGGRFEVHLAIVDVPDPRVDRLVKLFQPRKITCAKVTYADITGIEGAANKGSISGPLLNQLSQMDGFVQVVRCFDDSNISHPNGSVDPARDLAALHTEMLLNDLIIVERRLERLQDEMAKNGSRDKAQAAAEIELFERLKTALVDEKPVRALDFSQEEKKQLSGFGFLTQKPMLLLFNNSDGTTAPCIDIPGGPCEIVALQGKLEMDIAQLPEDEKAMFLVEYGIDQPGLKRVINQSYCLMDLQTFFTVGEDEVRAWTLPVDGTAFDAAGAIHTDLQKGFIRAEVVGYEDLIELGGLAEVRK